MSGARVVVVVVGSAVLLAAVVVALANRPEPLPVPRVRPIAPERLPAPGAPGALALQSACTPCHALPDPASHTAAAWPAVLRRMGTHAAMRTGRPPSPAEAQAIEEYLRAHAAPERP